MGSCFVKERKPLFTLTDRFIHETWGPFPTAAWRNSLVDCRFRRRAFLASSHVRSYGRCIGSFTGVGTTPSCRLKIIVFLSGGTVLSPISLHEPWSRALMLRIGSSIPMLPPTPPLVARPSVWRQVQDTFPQNAVCLSGTDCVAVPFSPHLPDFWIGAVGPRCLFRGPRLLSAGQLLLDLPRQQQLSGGPSARRLKY